MQEERSCNWWFVAFAMKATLTSQASSAYLAAKNIYYLHRESTDMSLQRRTGSRIPVPDWWSSFQPTSTGALRVGTNCSKIGFYGEKESRALILHATQRNPLTGLYTLQPFNALLPLTAERWTSAICASGVGCDLLHGLPARHYCKLSFTSK